MRGCFHPQGAFDLEKDAAGAAVAMMQAGIMDIECGFMVGKMLLGVVFVVDGE